MRREESAIITQASPGRSAELSVESRRPAPIGRTLAFVHPAHPTKVYRAPRRQSCSVLETLGEASRVAVAVETEGMIGHVMSQWRSPVAATQQPNPPPIVIMRFARP
jgi:hypothetical protein